MLQKRRNTFFSLFLILAVCLNLLNFNVVYADDATPTEPPPATEIVTEPPTATEAATEPPTATEVATELPVESTPTPGEATPTPAAEIPLTETAEVLPPPEAIIDENAPVEVILSEMPEDTSIVVLDEQGQALALGSQDAADAVVTSDPVWCPASVVLPTPGLNNCSGNYAGITELLLDMRTMPWLFDEAGTIFLEKPPGQGFTTPLILDDSVNSLSGSFATLSAFNLTIRGGWNVSPNTFSQNTNFGVSGGNEGYILIGSATNPWAGNITLMDLTISDVSVANSVTVYTSSGNIVLSDVEVSQQTGTNYTAYLESTSGNITVGNTSFFDGDNSGGDRNKGFFAITDTGAISITGTGTSPTFQDARGTDPANYNGATLSAPTVTLTNVISQDHDGNGIEINNANVVTLNNVTSGLNQNGEGNGLSGVLVNGNGSTTVTINGGSFNRNNRYGIEILSGGNITIVSNPTYAGNVLGNFYENTVPDTSITSTTTASNSTSASFSFTGTDNFTPPANLTFQCSLNGASFAACTSPINYAGLAEGNHNFQVRATDQIGNTDPSPASFSWIIDFTPPTISPHGDETVEATSAAGAVVNYTSPATFDAVDGPGVASCLPAAGSTFPLGDTTVDCTASDTSGNVATPTSFVVHVVDTTAPVIAPHADETIEATSAAGAIVNYTSPATSDAVDVPGVASCSPAAGSTFPLGDTTVDCTASDTAGNAAIPTSFVVHVVDTTAPDIAPHADETIEATSAAGALVSYTSPATSDAVDGSGTAACLPASGTQFAMGDTTVDCTASDTAGNAAIPTSFVVHVVDTTAPVIDAHGDEIVEATSAAGALVSYTSPATSDAVDIPGVASCSPASGSTFPVGDTTVDCTASDGAGNVATPTSFVVHVVDTTAPTLTLPANITANATGPAGAVVSYSATASDIVDGSVATICAPVSGSTFALGSTTVNCSATDAHFNQTNGSFVINVQDPDGPTLNLPANIVAEATSSAGVTVNYSASATDTVDGNVPVTCLPASGSVFPLGTTSVNCTASDLSNNVNQAAFLVTVEDSTAPTIAPHADITINTLSSVGIVVTFTSPATSDSVDGAGTATCLPASGSLFPIGNTQVTCSAVDSNGNSATSTFVVHLIKIVVTPPTPPTPTPAPIPPLTTNGFIIPITGGGVIDLACNSIFWVADIKIGFLNLCDYQSAMQAVDANSLPGTLPEGYSFVMGVDVDVLLNGQAIKELPVGSGIQFDFPVNDAPKDQFVVLYWSDDDGDGKGVWLEVSQKVAEDKLSETLITNAEDELYRITRDSLNQADDIYYPIVTTEKKGIFVLVTK